MRPEVSCRHIFQIGCRSELLFCLYDVGATRNPYRYITPAWKFHVAFYASMKSNVGEHESHAGREISCKHIFLISGRHLNQIGQVFLLKYVHKVK